MSLSDHQQNSLAVVNIINMFLKKNYQTICLLIVLLIGLFTQLYNIMELPPEYDEAIWGNVARNLLEQGFHFRNIWKYPTFVDHPPVHIYQIALSCYVFGISLISLRFPTILLTLLTGILYLLLYERLKLAGQKWGGLMVTALVIFLPQGIEMSRHSHVEVSVAFYGTAAIVSLVLALHHKRWFFIFIAGMLFSLSVLSKIIGFLYAIPLGLLLFQFGRSHGIVSRPLMNLLRAFFLFCIGVLVVIAVVTAILSVTIPIPLLYFYDGIIIKFIDVVSPEEVAKSPWRNVTFRCFFKDLYRTFFPAFPFGLLAGLIATLQFIKCKCFAGKVERSLEQPHKNELMVFWSATSFFCLLCFSSSATRNLNYAYLAMPFYCLVFVSVFWRLIENWRQKSLRNMPAALFASIVLVAFLGLIVQGFSMKKPWKIRDEKRIFQQIADVIKANTKPRHYVIINPYGPELSFLSHRPYEFLYTCQSVSEARSRIEKAHGAIIKREKLPHFSLEEEKFIQQIIEDKFTTHLIIQDFDLYFHPRKKPTLKSQ